MCKSTKCAKCAKVYQACQLIKGLCVTCYSKEKQTQNVTFKNLEKEISLENYKKQAKTNFEKNLLKDIIKNTDKHFLKWALHQIMSWKNENYSENIVHIQGDSDLILPHNFIKYDYLIKGGTHFMTLNQSKKIEQIILDNLA